MADRKRPFGPLGGPVSTLILIAAVCGCGSSNLWADEPPKAAAPQRNLPVPDASAQTAAEKKIRDAFPNYEKSPQDQRSATAATMLAAAVSLQDDPAALFVLLKKSGALAASAGDADTALKAASMLGQSFAMDSDELAAEWLRKASTVQLSAPAAKQLVDATLGFASAVALKLKFDVMARALAAADTTARNARDASLRSLVQARSAELKLVQADSIRAKSAQTALAKNPEDPEANFTFGRFLCLELDDWASGVRALARGSNIAYRRAAAAELGLPQESNKQIAVGDLWWELGDKDTARSKAALQRHAAAWYRKAEADTRLNALDKIKIENRLRLAGTTTTAADNNGKWLDLMHLIDPKKHAKVGTWKLENGVLTSGTENGERIQIPYIPPEEYDFRIVFARNAAGSSVVQYAPRGDREIVWWIGQNNKTFAMNDKAIGQSFAGIEAGKKYTSLIKVRRGSVQFFLNDRLILDEKDEDRLFEHGLWYALSDTKQLGVGSLFSTVSFYTIEIQEISGQGKLAQ